MGCGKSSVGRELSKLLCCPFIDLDTEIETRSGCTVAEIFETSGEAEFRRLEKETLKDILETGGRVLEIPKTPALDLLPQAARCKGSLDRLPDRSRPLAGGGMSSPSSSTPALSSLIKPETFNHTDSDMVLALGGGAVMTPECERMVHEQTVCVYLRTSVNELVARLAGEASGRPLLGTQPGTEDSALRTETLHKRIMDLMAKRRSTYEKTAHIIIDTDGKTVDAVSEEIVKSISSIF